MNDLNDIWNLRMIAVGLKKYCLLGLCISSKSVILFSLGTIQPLFED